MADDKPDLSSFTLDETVKLIVTACKRTDCSIRTRCKALVIYHQFKRCIEEMKFDPNLLAASCINLGVKSNGEDIELDAILMAFFSMLHYPRISILDEEFMKIKDSVIKMECIILRMIEFEINPTLAHDLLVYFLFDIYKELEALNLWHVVFDQCTKIASDLYLKNTSIAYKAEQLAIATIQAAFYISGINTEISPYMKAWLKRLKNEEKNKENEDITVEILEDIFRICEISPEAERRK